jgi:hypothetical protein
MLTCLDCMRSASACHNRKSNFVVALLWLLLALGSREPCAHRRNEEWRVEGSGGLCMAQVHRLTLITKEALETIFLPLLRARLPFFLNA